MYLPNKHRRDVYCKSCDSSCSWLGRLVSWLLRLLKWLWINLTFTWGDVVYSIIDWYCSMLLWHTLLNCNQIPLDYRYQASELNCNQAPTAACAVFSSVAVRCIFGVCTCVRCFSSLFWRCVFLFESLFHFLDIKFKLSSQLVMLLFHRNNLLKKSDSSVPLRYFLLVMQTTRKHSCRLEFALQLTLKGLQIPQIELWDAAGIWAALLVATTLTQIRSY